MNPPYRTISPPGTREVTPDCVYGRIRYGEALANLALLSGAPYSAGRSLAYVVVEGKEPIAFVGATRMDAADLAGFSSCRSISALHGEDLDDQIIVRDYELVVLDSPTPEPGELTGDEWESLGELIGAEKHAASDLLDDDSAHESEDLEAVSEPPIIRLSTLHFTGNPMRPIARSRR